MFLLFFFVLCGRVKLRFFCVVEGQKSITGVDAIRRARNLKYVAGASFVLIHVSCNLKTGECGQVVKHERCRVRAALREETFRMDGDMYFTYEDMDTGEPKMCFKRLMRYIGFPPDYGLLRIEWFE
jgi:hypothetical protein